MRKSKRGNYITGRVLMNLMVLAIISLSLAGCSDESKAETTEPAETQVAAEIPVEITGKSSETDFSNEEAISAFMNDLFTAPDTEFKELEKKKVQHQLAQGEMNEEEYQDFLESQPYEDYIAYIEKKFVGYFTPDEFEDILTSGLAPWYALNSLEGDYAASLERLEIKQSNNLNAEKNHHFTAIVEYKNHNGDIEEFEIEGMVIMRGEGKIGRFAITESDGFMERVQKDNNG